MAGRGTGPDFVEALARGLDVLTCMGAGRPGMTLAEIATAAKLARPTARRLLLTLAELGYVRADGPRFTLTPQVLRLGIAYASSLGLWDIARPHMAALVAQTRESSSMAQLDGADIVYVARVAVPKLITLRVDIGTRFPAPQTSQGKVLLAALPSARVAAVLAEPSRSGLPPFPPPDHGRFAAELAAVRARGWALADEELAPGIRSVAVPVRDGTGDRPRGDERHRARRRDLGRGAHRRASPPPDRRGRRGQRGLGAVAVPPARRLRHPGLTCCGAA